MGVVKKTTTIYVCDRCGFQSENPYAREGNATMLVSAGYKSYNGDIGGGEASYWLCGTCLTDWQKFMKEKGVETR